MMHAPPHTANGLPSQDIRGQLPWLEFDICRASVEDAPPTAIRCRYWDHLGGATSLGGVHSMNFSSTELAISVQAFITLVVLMDPVGIVPLFIALNSDKSIAQQERTARQIAIAVSGVLIASTLFGARILQYFFIGIAEFKVSGGLLLLLMSIQMLVTDNLLPSAEGKNPQRSSTVTPLGIPLLAGPGAISTVIIYGHNADSLGGYLLIIVDILLATLLAYWAMRQSHRISAFLGSLGIEIITKLAGLILGAIAIRFICQGLLTLLPGLA